MRRLARVLAKNNQRFMALFFVLGLIAPLGLEPVVQAQGFNPKDAASVAPIKITDSKQSAAADVVDSKGKLLAPGQVDSGGSGLQGSRQRAQAVKAHEVVSKRTASTDLRQNADGSYTQRNYMAPHYFKQTDGQWPNQPASLLAGHG